MNDNEDLKRAVGDRAADFAAWLFPHGKRVGSGWHVGDVSGAPGESLAIDLDGEFAGRYRDWSNDERGDCIALVMASRGLDFVSAKRLLCERYGIATAPRRSAGYVGKPVDSSKGKAAPALEQRAAKRPQLPDLERGSRADLLSLSTARNLAPAALDIASERGLLWFYDSSECGAWLITDRRRRNAQARRLDGKPWKWNGKKAWTLGGSCASWPIGLPESEPFASIALCEGTPDFISVFHHALASGVEESVAPVCMVGAGLSILADCLPAFTGKRVRIFVHDDAEGLTAAGRWAGQLRGIAGRVDGFTFDGLMRNDGAPVKDLCDLASIDADSWEANRDTVENCMAFAIEGRAA
ncbi:MAG: hypothetical protein ABI680_08260 [Chthoniobacteraceae bacterium]